MTCYKSNRLAVLFFLAFFFSMFPTIFGMLAVEKGKKK